MNPLLQFASFIARLLPQAVKKGIYRVKPLARLLRRSLNAAAPQGLTEVKVAVGELAGMTFALDLQTEKDYWLGTYETDLQQAARKFTRPGMVIYDIGANIGYISMLFAHLSGENGSIYSFEALTENIQRLTHNIQLNHLQDRVHVNACAVVDYTRTVTFMTHSSGAMGKVIGSAGRDEHYLQKIRVNGLALDDFVFKQKNPAPDVIKMDIEGGEVLAIKGMRRILKESRPVFFIELHGEESAGVVWDSLTGCGYEFFLMKKGYKRVTTLNQIGWKAYIIAQPIS